MSKEFEIESNSGNIYKDFMEQHPLPTQILDSCVVPAEFKREDAKGWILDNIAIV
jgi:hypothetical protein